MSDMQYITTNAHHISFHFKHFLIYLLFMTLYVMTRSISKLIN